jgi:hypothetical protein
VTAVEEAIWSSNRAVNIVAHLHPEPDQVCCPGSCHNKEARGLGGEVCT